MIELTDKKSCCGCGACARVCPKGCVAMTEDAEGFKYPEINKSACVGCGACERVCPVINAEKRGNSVLSCFAAWSNNTAQRLKSSSGGVFPLLGREVLGSGGTVCGVALSKKLEAEHIFADSEEQLESLLGSKYLQSDAGACFKKTREALLCGKTVLFTGTGCQISALKRFLSRDYDNLITVDVLCHGVPSARVWRKYIAEAEEALGAKITSANFRSKSSGWRTYSMELAAGRKKYSKIVTEDPYLKLFRKNLDLRPSCHDCRFKALERDSDLTLGDFWGVEKHLAEHDDKGVSLVLVHSEKGRRLLDKISGGLKLTGVDSALAVPEGSEILRSAAPHPQREEFFKRLEGGESIKNLSRLADDPVSKRLKTRLAVVKRKIFK